MKRNVGQIHQNNFPEIYKINILVNFMIDFYFLFHRVSKHFEAFNFLYILPFYRFTAYGIGILLGKFLNNNKNLKLSKFQRAFGWLISTFLLISTFILTGLMNPENKIHNSLYASLASIPFCLFFAWIILMNYLGYESKFWLNLRKLTDFSSQISSSKSSNGNFLISHHKFPMEFTWCNLRFSTLMSLKIEVQFTLNSLR